MKLYYSAGSCSTSCVIALEESGIACEVIHPNWDQPDAALAEMERLNPLKVTPVLTLDDGRVLTQNIAILHYFDALKPEAGLFPRDPVARAQAMAWLSFVASDLHKTFTPLFALRAMSESEETRTDVRKWALNNLKGYLTHLNEHLTGKQFLMGDAFCAADMYCSVVMGWAPIFQVQVAEYPHLAAYLARVAERPSVVRAKARSQTK